MKTWSIHRREVKLYAKRHFSGSFLKGIFAAILSFAASLFALSFVPLQIPVSFENIPSPRELVLSFFPDGNLENTIYLLGISLLLYILLTAPLSIGKHRYYLMAMRSQKPKFKVVLTPFLNLGQVFSSCALVVLTAVFEILLAAILFVIPIGLLIFSPTLGPLAQIAGLVLYIVAFFMLLILFTPFAIAPFVLADKPELGAFKSILLAFKMLRGAKREFLVFDLSFVLWRLLFGVNAPGVFLIEPYITASQARFYDTIDACKE